MNIRKRAERKILNLRLFIPVCKSLVINDHYAYDYHDIKALTAEIDEDLDFKKKEHLDQEDPCKVGNKIMLSPQAIAAGAGHH